MILTTSGSTFLLTLVPHSKMKLISNIAALLVLALAAGNVAKIARDLGYSGISEETVPVRIQLF